MTSGVERDAKRPLRMLFSCFLFTGLAGHTVMLVRDKTPIAMDTTNMLKW